MRRAGTQRFGLRCGGMAWIGVTWRAAAVLALGPLLVPVNAIAQEALFHEGNRLYQEGDFSGAAGRYAAVLESGYESFALYYNLGNAHFRLGEMAEAVLNYERAARLDPGDEDVRANLALVGQMLQDRIEPLPRFWMLSVFDWWMALMPRGRIETAAAASYVVLGVAAVLIVLGRPRGWGVAVRRAAYVGAVGTVIFGGTLLVRETGLGQPEQAIVMVPEAQVLSAPSDDGGLTVFTLHEGTKVRIDRRAGEWAEIVLMDGKVGWLRLALLEVI